MLDAPLSALVVKIDVYSNAEPQSGLNQADIVFEEIVEGQATRFAAVFNSMEANPVGPIRSGCNTRRQLAVQPQRSGRSSTARAVNEAVNSAPDKGAGFELLGEGTPDFCRSNYWAGAPQPLRQPRSAPVAAAASSGTSRPTLF